jgi:superfamily II DNA or RNA helicase
MPGRRRFNRRERVALSLVAGGVCKDCGEPLPPGWHADHRIPYSRGGDTDVVNGQAFCPRCNLKKGNRMIDPRDRWQGEATGEALSKDSVLIEACPGAGKTRLGLNVARIRLDQRHVDRLLTVVPTDNLKHQWSKAAHKYANLQLNESFLAGDVLHSDYHGAVVTYQAVASNPEFWRTFTAEFPTFVTLDEIHHVKVHDDDPYATGRSWSEAVNMAFSPARCRLLLTGTPFRSDGKSIPWVNYVEGRSEPDYVYSYVRAVKEGVVRALRFDVLDGQMVWRDVLGAVRETSLQNATEDDESNALATALNPNQPWIRSMLQRMDDELTYVRERGAPKAAGLVVAKTIPYANAYGQLLAEITGQEPTVVHGKVDDPNGKIDAFRESTDRWIIAVQMISEGVDIPRLAVGVYASNKLTEMAFRQIVGRTTRRNSEDSDDDESATWAIPGIGRIRRLAANVEREADAALAEREEETRREVERGEREFTMYEALAASEASYLESIYQGGTVPGPLLEKVERYFRDLNIRNQDPVITARAILDLGGHSSEVPVAHMSTPAPTQSVHERTQTLKNLVVRRGRRLALEQEVHFKVVFGALNRAVGEKTMDHAGIESLEKRLQLLDSGDLSWLRLN